MNISPASMYVRKCEIDFLKFMNVSCLPNYTIATINITQEQADSQGYAVPANVKYDFNTNTHHMSIWTILPALSADYILFHEFTHMVDTERFCKSNQIKYIANKVYTEYHASQVALMKMLGAKTIDSTLYFTMEQTVCWLLLRISQKANLSFYLDISHILFYSDPSCPLRICNNMHN